MGVVVSSNSPTSPFFLVSGIIGIVSFAFTLGTFLKVVWVNVETATEAPHEVHAYLTNLRTELLEEQMNLKAMRKGMRKRKRLLQNEEFGGIVSIELDQVSLKTMNDSVKHLCRRFRDLEKPFLEEGELGINCENLDRRTRKRRRNSSVSPPEYDHAAYSSPPEKRHRARSRARSNHDRDRHDNDADEEAYWAQRVKYRNFTLGKRFLWIRKKTEAQNLFEMLSRVQIRRIARQVGGMTMMMHQYSSGTMELNEAVRRIDERVSRVVGVRRVD